MEGAGNCFDNAYMSKLADCKNGETPVSGPFSKSLILCPKIPSGDLVLKIFFKDFSEFLFFRNALKFESVVEVRLFFSCNKKTGVRCEDNVLLKS